MMNSGFHISINGPEGTTFPSFPSSDLTGGNPSKTVLSFIRRKCTISTKLFFTVDGKSPVSDNLTLAYYMSLTDAGTKILNAGNYNSQNGSDRKETADEKDGEEDDAETEGDQATPKSTVATFNISVAGKDSNPRPLMPLPAKNEALAKLVEGMGKGGLELGKIPTFSDRALASLTGDYATLASEAKYPYPSDMKENDWNCVLENNRALYGYWFDYSAREPMRKAKKKAFRLRNPNSIRKQASKQESDQKPPAKQESDQKPPASNVGVGLEVEQSLPPVPPFYVYDDASVNIVEVRTQAQYNLTKQGFNSSAMSFSLGGAAKGVSGSFEASNQVENATANQAENSKAVQSLIVSYNFPRVVVELDNDCLELTDECRRDAMSVKSKVEETKFYRKYGNVFVCSFALGGYLQSTRLIQSEEVGQLSQIKNSARTSAGLSIQTPFFSAGANYATSNGDSTDTGMARLQQDARLTWDAHGGDTILCSNPPAWASTVKDFNLWRLMDQQQIMQMETLIKRVDFVAWNQLESPWRTKTGTGPDATTVIDPEEAERYEILSALDNDEPNDLVQSIMNYYWDNNLDTGAAIKAYNDFMKEKYPDPEWGVYQLAPGINKFNALSDEQKLGVCLYMRAKKAIKPEKP